MFVDKVVKENVIFKNKYINGYNNLLFLFCYENYFYDGR